jgi:hypothetical protein
MVQNHIVAERLEAKESGHFVTYSRKFVYEKSHFALPAYYRFRDVSDPTLKDMLAAIEVNKTGGEFLAHNKKTG